MLSLIVATLLAQTYPVFSGNINQTNPSVTIGLSIPGSGEVDTVFTQTGTAQGNMQVFAVPLGPTGQPSGPAVDAGVNGTTGAVTLKLSPFTGPGINVGWALAGPTDYFNTATLTVNARPSAPDGGVSGPLIPLSTYAVVNTILSVNTVMAANSWPTTYNATINNFSGYVSTQGQGDTAGTQNIELYVTDGTKTCYVGLPCDAGIGLFTIPAGDGTCAGLTGAILEVGPKDGGATCTTLPKVDSITVNGQLITN